ncbi:folate-binding protein YgfZ [Methylococcaceae bacterium WWC4]|nr:folate-binding protein YgfZ [Methylococcaceae bacterium WWC4]
MNTDTIDKLPDNLDPRDEHATLYPATGLAAIEVIGADSARFLQGQLTCDIQQISETQASIAAFCNAKGRVISTLLVIKKTNGYWLVMPTSLVTPVIEKLRKYVLRAAVTLGDASDRLSVAGLTIAAGHEFHSLPLPEKDWSVGHAPLTIVKLPGRRRFLILEKHDSAILTDLISRPETDWRYQDMLDGLPWFDASQSEQHLPQMLNIDGLGGISFTKGCYTGQEIVARSHYLGKVKRRLLVGGCAGELTIAPGTPVLDGDTGQTVGGVLSSAHNGDTRLLLVLHALEGESKRFILGDEHQTPLSLILAE